MRAILLAVSLLPLSGCWSDAPEVMKAEGKTMGTTYHVTVVGAPGDVDDAGLAALIEGALADVNAQMNNWDPDSELSRFNASPSIDPVPVSAALETVMTEANRIHALSGGKFDVTLAPLIDLWGFGPRKPGQPVPTEAEIGTALMAVGQSGKLVLEDHALRKTQPDVTVNLSAIAKGYGADRVGTALAAAGISHYVVEIGGDLVAHGLNAEDKPWVVGIERPVAASQTLQQIVPVSDMGMATSGDYRNYFEEDGVRYSHIIDPTTGRPITHTTASVTVLAPSGMTADGMATALLAVGGRAALDIATAENLPVMIIERKDGGFVTSTSPAFDALMTGPAN